MNFNQVIREFNSGLNWNACFYIIYKSITTLFTLFLYKNLTSHDFTLWAVSNSSIYIMLLWVDFGFRKSIPRYSPVFAQDYTANAQFIKYIILFYILMLCLLSTLFIIAITVSQSYIHKPNILAPVEYYAPAIFITEGINTLLRTIFHAHFFIKQYNMLAAIFLAINLMLDINTISSKKNSADILLHICMNKIIIGTLMIIFSISFFYIIKTSGHKQRSSTKVSFYPTMMSFAQHSGMMWVNTLLKSLSERNALVPLIAFFGGPESVSVFKISHDGALLFQRIVLKTIGTTDTSLLAYAETANEDKKLMQVAFTKLTQKMAALCLPLIGVTLYIGVSSIQSEITSEGFQVFIALSLGYLIEMLFMPYERILEVKRAYKALLIAYAPYIMLLSLVIFYTSQTWIGLFNFVCLIYCVRLVSVFIMVLLARTKFGLYYPVSYVLNLLGFISTASIGLYVFFNAIHVNPYLSLLSMFL